MKKLLVLLFLAVSLSAQDELIIFSDSPDGDIFYDSSWGFRKSPSSLELAGNNDKFPVDADVVFQGSHSLRLRWRSQPGGDWGVAVARPHWQAMDFTLYDSLIYWINAEEAISKSALPDIALEDVSNTKSKRLWLGDYLASVDADVAAWQKVAIAIDDFKGGSADFSQIKTVFHFQKAADGDEHTAYIDEMRVAKKGGGGGAPNRPQGLTAKGYANRIDLHWQANNDNVAGYHVYAADDPQGPFARVSKTVHEPVWFSDYFGENERTRWYYIVAVNSGFMESAPSDTAYATSHAMDDEALLTSVQEAAFRYFYDYGHPVSGLARERKGSGHTCTSGGTGFGLMNFPVAVERGFIGREEAAARVLKICTFLRDKAQRHHGAWSHWIHGETGAVIPFSRYDDGADLVETAFLVQGLLTVRQYFDVENDVETQIRQIATQLWQEVDWSWFRKESRENVLYWHWSPNYGWKMNMQIRGFNETMIVYILAIASPTHGVPASLYYDGWAGGAYWHGKSHYGILQFVGPEKGGPLFFTHYSFLGLNPHTFTDKYCNYFINNRNITLINRAYCMDNPKGCRDYGELVWGLTASDDYAGYDAHSPTNDNCTITPTAAISAMPYTPEESMAALKHFYYEYGDRLWGEFGFKDAFSPEHDWFAESVLAIDQGTMAPMIENHRTGLLWDLFMSNEEIQRAVHLITSVKKKVNATIRGYELLQNFPNPFNPTTTIRFHLPESAEVTLVVFDLTGKEVARIHDRRFLTAGEHTATYDASSSPAGVYLLRLMAGGFEQTRKMVVIK